MLIKWNSPLLELDPDPSMNKKQHRSKQAMKDAIMIMIPIMIVPHKAATAKVHRFTIIPIIIAAM